MDINKQGVIASSGRLVSLATPLNQKGKLGLMTTHTASYFSARIWCATNQICYLVYWALRHRYLLPWPCPHEHELGMQQQVARIYTLQQ